jgi:hypothetical protein
MRAVDVPSTPKRILRLAGPAPPVQNVVVIGT